MRGGSQQGPSGPDRWWDRSLRRGSSFKQLAMRAVLLTFLAGLAGHVIPTEPRPAELCNRWVDVIWKLSAFDEGADEIYMDDFYTHIRFLENEGLEMHVTFDEFYHYWRCTLMYEEDIRYIFDQIAQASNNPNSDPEVIEHDDIQPFWMDLMGQSIITKAEFELAWETEVLPHLPHLGCEDERPSDNPDMDYLFCSQLLDGGF